MLRVRSTLVSLFCVVMYACASDVSSLEIESAQPTDGRDPIVYQDPTPQTADWRDVEPTPAAPAAAPAPIASAAPAPMDEPVIAPAAPAAPVVPADAMPTATEPETDAGVEPPAAPTPTPACRLPGGNIVTCDTQSNWYGELRWWAGNVNYGCASALSGAPYEACVIGDECYVAQSYGARVVGVCHASGPVGG